MRALGLPNTKHFHEITKIEDAMSRTLPPPPPSSALIRPTVAFADRFFCWVWARGGTVAEKLKHEGKQDARVVDTMEELEDAEGNVYDRKTFGASPFPFFTF